MTRILIEALTLSLSLQPLRVPAGSSDDARRARLRGIFVALRTHPSLATRARPENDESPRSLEHPLGLTSSSAAARATL